MFAAGSMLLGSALGAFGQYEANKSNERIGHENNAFSAREAAMNRDFQERMSNTSWQRGVSDMRSAGVNPMLAVSQGGASSPSGNSAQGIATANQQNEMSNFSSSARELAQLQLQSKLTDAQVMNQVAQANQSSAQTAKIMADTHKSQFFGNLWNHANSALSFVEKNGSKYYSKGNDLFNKLMTDRHNAFSK